MKESTVNTYTRCYSYIIVDEIFSVLAKFERRRRDFNNTTGQRLTFTQLRWTSETLLGDQTTCDHCRRIHTARWNDHSKSLRRKRLNDSSVWADDTASSRPTTNVPSTKTRRIFSSLLIRQVVVEVFNHKITKRTYSNKTYGSMPASETGVKHSSLADCGIQQTYNLALKRTPKCFRTNKL